jgi:AcrR family transcriptional regulator
MATTIGRRSHLRSETPRLMPGDEPGRILAAALHCFLERDYPGTTLPVVADRAGLTTSTLSRLYGSERELFLAVADLAEATVFGRLRLAARGQATLVAAVEGVLDAIPGICHEEPETVRFLALAETAFLRNAQLRSARATRWPGRQRFAIELAHVGAADGELAHADALTIADTLSALLAGLWQTATLAPEGLAPAIDGLKRGLPSLCR